MESCNLPDVGTRFSLATHRGTIRWVGEVTGSRGIWLGVEWDDASRGKHSGEHEGRRYFTCRIPNSGSFLRYNLKISFGSSFLQALKARYIHDKTTFAQSQNNEMSQKYTRKNLADIDIETPNLDAIIQKSSQLHKLRAVGLGSNDKNEHHDVLVARAIDSDLGEDVGSIASTCPNVTSLDLSRSLIPSWLELSKITAELPKLKSIQLHFNRLAPPFSGLKPIAGAFKELRELQMDGSLVKWNEILNLSTELPLLETLQLSSNDIKRLNGADTAHRFMKLKILNLEGNLLEEWKDVYDSLVACPILEKLILSSNPIETSNDIEGGNLNVQHVSLWDNPIESWHDLEMLDVAFGGLQSITLGGEACPLACSSSPSEIRLIAIARLRNLHIWNNTVVSLDERREAELYYLSLVSKEDSTGVEREKLHPRFAALVQSHDTPVLAAEVKLNGTLRSKLLTVRVHLCEQPPSSRFPYLTAIRESKSMPLLTTTPLRLLQSKLARSFQLKKGPKSISSIWALLGQSLDASQIFLQQIRSEMGSNNDSYSEERIVYQMDNLERDLQGYNFSQDDEIVLVIES